MAESFTSLSYRGESSGPHLLVSAGVHGDEFEPIVAAKQLASVIDPQTGSIQLRRGQLTIVPVVNQTAFELGQRCGADGLDLARVCPGCADGSVTEQAAFRLSELIRQSDCFIDLHTGGTLFSISPLAGYILHRDQRILDQQREMAKAFNLPLVWGTSAGLEGRSLSVARDANVPAIYCEYGGGGGCDDKGVAAYVSGCLNVMSLLGMISQVKPNSQVKHLVEDSAPASGHMQICHPSPVTGMVRLLAGLGDYVAAQQPVAMITPISGSDESEILADRSGMIVVLRTFPSVRKGESVGVVIEVPQ